MKIQIRTAQKIFLLLIIILAGLLRFYQIDTIPPGLYQDEAAIGYNAYTILTKGVDEYGTKYPLLFRSFGDYKLPGYIYTTAISMAIFGKTEFAIRFPSALMGTITVFIFYLFINELLNIDTSNLFHKKRRAFALFGSFLLAISPWHIQFSRGGFEATEAFFFFVLAGFLTLFYWRKKNILALFSGVFFFALTMYTYHPYRIIAPIIVSLIFFTFAFVKKLPKNHLAVGFIFLVLLSIPYVKFSLTKQGTARLAQTSFVNEHPTHTLLEAASLYPLIYLKNYISFFSLSFLFSEGDGIGRHQMAHFGLLPYWQLFLLFIGLVGVFYLKRSLFKYTVIVLGLLAPIAASLVVPSPHTLRSELMIIPLILIITYGLFSLLKSTLPFKKVFLCLVLIAALYESSYYLHFYYVHYPKINALDWGGNYKEVVQEAEEYKKNYSYIVVDNYFSFAAIYFKFYSDDIRPVFADSTWKKPKSWGSKKALYIRPYYGDGEKDAKIIKTIYLNTPNKDVFARFWEI